MDDVRDLVSAVGPYLSDALVSPSSLADLERLTRRLPRHVAGVTFECRLGDSDAPADLSLRFGRTDGGREILSGRGIFAGPAAGLLGHPLWSRIHRFAREWASPQSPLHDRIGGIWLEFDVCGPPARVPLPNVFLDPSVDASLNGDGSIRPGWAAGVHQMLVGTALPLLLGHPVPRETDRKLLECLTMLPSGGFPYSVGMMLTRPTRGIRLCALGISPTDAPEYLRRVGWTSSIREVEAIIAKFGALADLMLVDLDVDESIGPAIGLEFACRQKDGSVDQRLPLLADLLMESGLCLPDKRRAVVAWPGVAPYVAALGAWPDSLALPSFANLAIRGILDRMVTHIKLTYHPDRPLQAKAYLSCRVRRQSD
jgi:hypothetical protein